MLRWVLIAGLVVLTNSSLLAEQPKAKSGAAPSSKAQVEAILQSPANLDFKGREKVTIKELLAQLRDQRQLSIRVDMPTLMRMYNPDSNNYATQIGAVHKRNSAEYQVAITSLKPVAPVVPAQPAAPEAKPSLIAPATAGYPSNGLPVPLPSEKAAARLALPPLVEAASPKPLPADGEPADAKKQPAEPPKPMAAATEAEESVTLDSILKREVNIALLDMKRTTVATVLRQALDAFPSPLDEYSAGMPIALSNAANIDYLVEDNGLVITTRLAALTYKETRVYSLKGLKDVKPEQLSLVIRESVRPWSWRSRIDELGDKLKAGGVPILPEAVTSLLKSGIQLASAEVGIPTDTTVSFKPDSSPADEKPESKESKDTKMTASDVEQMKLLGNALVNSAVTAAHASLTTLEVVHHADPPTGVIQVLPGKLIITQSQAAHREIAELLKQLSEE